MLRMNGYLFSAIVCQHLQFLWILSAHFMAQSDVTVATPAVCIDTYHYSEYNEISL